MIPNISINNQVRRRYILGKQGLWPGRRWTGKDGVTAALNAVEAIQIDPVSVVAESPDIVLWGRVAGYQPEYLDRVMYAERKFFDYGGALFVYPMQELPYWRVMMERSKSNQRWQDFIQANPALVDIVRQELRSRGPLRSRDLEGKAVNYYRAGKDTGVVLYYLWLTGELMSHSRQGKERLYDFLENIAPPELQWCATGDQAVKYFSFKAVSHLSLIDERRFRSALKQLTERPVDVAETKKTLAEMVEAGQLAGLHLEKHKEPLYFPASDIPLLETLSEGSIPAEWLPTQTNTEEEVVFLSPLEYVSARGRAKELFGFDYVWEIYKPANTRKYGPYTMPVLYGDQLVARIDFKLDRQAKTLVINGFWLEEWFAPDDAFALAFARGLLNFATFLGVKQINTAVLVPSALKAYVDQYLAAYA